jgi:hypothetical protein
MSEALVPPHDWVNFPDPQYDTACPACSALVENRAVHRAWHIAMVDKTERYVEPPRYGGLGSGRIN